MPFFPEHFHPHFLISGDVQLRIQLGLMGEALKRHGCQGKCSEGLWEFKVGAHVAFQRNIIRSK